jgi:formylglycine-generating enzyme
MRVSCTLALVAVGAFACADSSLPPQGQVVLYLDTDAPVRAPSARAGTTLEPVALFDRVLVEIYPPGEEVPCPDCRREIVIDAEKMHALDHSFGFVPRPRTLGFRARLVLFRSGSGLAPRRDSSIELIGYLPAVAEEGITELTATFRTDDVGKTRGSLKNPILFDRGAPTASAEGTWPGARVVDCGGTTPAGALCVPGGAFFMGDPRVSLDADLAGQREHLVVVSPFFLDEHEVTVGELRASGLVTLDSRGRSIDPTDDLRDDSLGKCDYSSAPGANEERPVVCVSWQLAKRFCEKKGGRLPSEAELEIVTSLRGTSLLPWGDRDPACDEAIIARDLLKKNGGCSERGEFDLDRRVLPERAGSGSIDRVALPSGVIFDLGANVSEWTRDSFQTDDGTCWASPLLRDPTCEDTTTDERSIKGGNLIGLPVDFAQARRAKSAKDVFFRYETVGFRCSYPAEPR